MLLLESVADRVLALARAALDLACGFFGRAFGLGSLVAGDLADCFLH